MLAIADVIKDIKAGLIVLPPQPATSSKAEAGIKSGPTPKQDAGIKGSVTPKPEPGVTGGPPDIHIPMDITVKANSLMKVCDTMILLRCYYIHP